MEALQEPKPETPKEEAKEPTLSEKIKALLDKKADTGLTAKEELTLRTSTKQLRQNKRVVESYKNFSKQYQKLNAEKRRRVMSLVKAAKATLGKGNSEVLLGLFTQQEPDQVDKDGKTIKGKKQVNYYGFLLEAKNAIVLRREERIELGKRKRSTGRSSDRKAHKSAVKFIASRNEQEVNKESK